MKFRKKPVIIDAFKWTAGPDQHEDPIWIIEAIIEGKVYFINSGSEFVQMVISTLEGEMRALIGDYIIKGVKGEIYPCKPDIFEMTYEEV